MKSFIKILLLLSSIILIQVSVLPQYIMPAFKPDLLLILMVYLALRTPIETSLPSSYLLGMLKDCIGGIYLGLNAFSFLAVYIFIKSVSDRLYVRSGLLFVITVSLATAVTLSINLLLLAVFSQAHGVVTSVFGSIVPHILVNAFVASLLAAMPVFSAPWTSK